VWFPVASHCIVRSWTGSFLPGISVWFLCYFFGMDLSGGEAKLLFLYMFYVFIF
jgi:hypothetical protein